MIYSEYDWFYKILKIVHESEVSHQRGEQQKKFAHNKRDLELP